jgi:hypothetical protein
MVEQLQVGSLEQISLVVIISWQHKEGVYSVKSTEVIVEIVLFLVSS